MAEHPIIFSAPLIRAILDGRKTQTRRLLKGRPPKFASGDTLWVQEVFARPLSGNRNFAFYEADGVRQPKTPRTPWIEARHMPRDLSRITLAVTDVRIQFVQDISEADAMAEGVDAPPSTLMPDRPYAARFRALWDSIYGDGAWDRNDEVAAYTFTVLA